jgi:hypothetical protein
MSSDYLGMIIRSFSTTVPEREVECGVNLYGRYGKYCCTKWYESNVELVGRYFDIDSAREAFDRCCSDIKKELNDK